MRAAELQLWEAPREMWLRQVLVVAILLLNVADVLTTQMSLARGGIEMNPLSSFLIENGILPHAKIFGAAFIAVAAAAASSHRRVSSLLKVVAGFYVLVVATNAVQLLLHG